jgi:hypothetical protein
MHMTLLGALLALSPRPLYRHVAAFGGLSPLQDQHLGGAIMLLVGGASYLLGGLWLTARLLRGAMSVQEERACAGLLVNGQPRVSDHKGDYRVLSPPVGETTSSSNWCRL